MEATTASRRKTQSMDMYKEVFDSPILVERTYYNKKKKPIDMKLKEKIFNQKSNQNKLFHNILGENSGMDNVKASEQKVSNWMKQNESSHRKPLSDLNPNVCVPKMCLRSRSSKKIETGKSNLYMNKVNLNKTYIGDENISRIEAKGAEPLTDKCEEVVNTASIKSDDAISIVSSEPTIVDKDTLACQAVLLQSEAEMLSKKKSELEKLETSALEGSKSSLRRSPRNIKKPMSDIPTHKKEDKNKLHTDIKSKKRSTGTYLKENKCKKRKYSKQKESISDGMVEINKEIKSQDLSIKMSVDVGVQVDTPCPICSNSNKKEKQMSTQRKFDESFDDILPEGIMSCTSEKENVENENKSVNSNNSCHNISGIHTVNVSVHSLMHSQDIHETITSKLVESDLQTPRQRLSNERFRNGLTPPYGITPPSNSSSNKENYHCLTPTDDLENRKNKFTIKTSARRKLLDDSSSTINIMCSRLTDIQIANVRRLCNILGWKHSDSFHSQVTHLVVNVDDENRAQRTAKFVCAVAAGAYVLSYGWVEQCLDTRNYENEESFEVLDTSGQPGPRRARLSSRTLFSRFTFCCLPSITTIHHTQLSIALKACGARLVASEMLTSGALLAEVVVLHEPHGHDHLHTYFDMSRCLVPAVAVEYAWAVECLSQHRLLSPRPFLLAPHHVDGATLDRLEALCCYTPHGTHLEK